MKQFGDKIFAVINIFGLFEYIQKRFRSPLQNTNEVERKRALDNLDEEIESLGDASQKVPEHPKGKSKSPPVEV